MNRHRPIRTGDVVRDSGDKESWRVLAVYWTRKGTTVTAQSLRNPNRIRSFHMNHLIKEVQ